MSFPVDPSPPVDAALLAAWAAQSREWLVATDAAGRVRWCNAAAGAALGLGAGTDLLAIAPADEGSGSLRAALAAALRDGAIAAGAGAWRLRGGDGAELRAEVRLVAAGTERLWSFTDTTERHALQDRAERLAERIELAQASQRIGFWSQDLAGSLVERDRQTLVLLGFDPTGPRPTRDELNARVHPDDRDGTYDDSLRRAGRHAKRFRALIPDGSVRLLQSQWEVRVGPDGRPGHVLGVAFDDTEAYAMSRSRDAAAAQLELVTRLANVAIWRHDFRPERVVYDERGSRLLDLPHAPEGITLAEALAGVHPDDLEKLASNARDALATGTPTDLRVRHRLRDGRWRDLLMRRAIEHDAEGRPARFVGVMLDIGDHFEQARRAEQLAARLEATTRGAQLGVWTARREDGQVLDFNDQMYRLFDGLPAGLLPNIDEFYRYCVDPQDRTMFADAVGRYNAHPVGTFDVEFRARRRDAGTRWIAIRCNVQTVGSVPQLLGIAMDVTDRHEAQTVRDREDARTLLIARQAGIGTWQTDVDGAHAAWDEQMWRLRGLEPQAQPLGRDARLAIVHPEDRPVTIDTVDPDAMPTSSAYEFRIRHADGRYRWLASRSIEMSDADGRLTGRIGINWDVTDAKNTEIARQKALLAERESRAKSRFLARMSHELRTPLNAVLGFAQLLEHDALLENHRPRATTLGHIRTAGQHLLTLIDDALDLSRVETGAIKLDLRAVSVATAIDEALPLVSALAVDRDVLLERLPLDGAVRADPLRLRQVLLNLLTNAIKYNRPGGRVTLSAGPMTLAGDNPAGASAARTSEIRLCIADTGRGIEPAQLPHLFEPFNRLGVEHEGIQGSGIGLTIVKSLVEEMGGRIEIASTLGVGTTFGIVLPAAPAAEPPPSEPVVPPPARSAARRVLYIEDNPVNVLLVEELLKLRPHLAMATAPTGTEGVAAARALAPDLILVDMQLPDFDGFEVLRRLRADGRTAGLRCIALSANAMPEDVRRARDSGFDAYWTKPIQFKPFLAEIDRLLPVR